MSDGMGHINKIILIIFCICSKPVLNRCVPKNIKDVGEKLLSNVYGLLNSWDFLEQILGDLYNSWKEILGFALLAFGK